MAISPARRAAFDVLRRVEEEGSYASWLLSKRDERLRSEDRALCHELVFGVLRQQLWLDRVLEKFSARPLQDLDLPVKLALRIGLIKYAFFLEFHWRRRSTNRSHWLVQPD